MMSLFILRIKNKNEELIRFCKTLEQVCVETIESGKMTKKLALCIHGKNLKPQYYLQTENFLEELEKKLRIKLNNLPDLNC